MRAEKAESQPCVTATFSLQSKEPGSSPGSFLFRRAAPWLDVSVRWEIGLEPARRPREGVPADGSNQEFLPGVDTPHCEGIPVVRPVSLEAIRPGRHGAAGDGDRPLLPIHRARVADEDLTPIEGPVAGVEGHILHSPSQGS